HMGPRRPYALSSAGRERAQTVRAVQMKKPAEIAAAKNASLIMIRNMAFFLGKKIQNIRGKPTGNCAETGGSIAAVQEAPCLASVELGGTKTVKAAGAASGVEITTGYAAHDSNLSRELLTHAPQTRLD